MRLPVLPLLPLAWAAAPAAAETAPESFFVGRVEGSGTVAMRIGGDHWVRGRSTGRIAADGALILEEVVEEEGKPVRRRHWRLVRRGRSVTGTISDARGAVTGTVEGNTLRLAYRAVEANAWVEQTIAFHPGARTATNRMVFKVLGIRAATLRAELRRVE